MFNTVSMTGTGGAIVVLLQVILPLFGVDLQKFDVPQIVEALTTIVGAVLLIWGQIRRKDMVAGIIRKR